MSYTGNPYLGATRSFGGTDESLGQSYKFFLDDDQDSYFWGNNTDDTYQLVLGGSTFFTATAGATLSFSGPLQTADDKRLNMGGSGFGFFEWDTHQTNDALVVGLYTNASMRFMIGNAASFDSNYDFGMSDASDPTFSVHSANDATDEWIAFSHDRTDAVIENGSGDMYLNAVGVVKFGTHTAIGSESLSGYITVKDSGGTSRKLAVIS